MFYAGKLRSVGSLDTAGRSLRAAEIGRGAKAVVVAKAFRAKAVRAYGALAKACAPKLCTVERTGQEAEAKIGVILALCR